MIWPLWAIEKVASTVLYHRWRKNYTNICLGDDNAFVCRFLLYVCHIVGIYFFVYLFHSLKSFQYVEKRTARYPSRVTKLAKCSIFVFNFRYYESCLISKLQYSKVLTVYYFKLI